MHSSDGPVLPIAPLDANRPVLPVKLRDLPAAAVRPAVPAAQAEPKAGDQEPATVVEPRGPEADEEVRAIPAPRERFGHYVVLHQIGEGAMGVVLAAYDQHLDRKVALKLLRADIDDSDEGVHHRMRREAQAMARLSHPNVVQVYEAGEVDGHLFLAMEFIQGVTLRAWMTQRQRPWHEVLPMFLQAGRGLAAAHVAGLTHRDFKPESGLASQVAENTSVSRLRRGYVPNLYQAGRPVKSPHANSAHSSARARSPHDRVTRVTPPAHPRHL